jgi:hypothetical protein
MLPNGGLFVIFIEFVLGGVGSQAGVKGMGNGCLLMMDSLVPSIGGVEMKWG